MVNNYEIQKAVRAAKLMPKAKPVVVIEPHIAVMPAPAPVKLPTFTPKAIDE